MHRTISLHVPSPAGGKTDSDSGVDAGNRQDMTVRLNLERFHAFARSHSKEQRLIISALDRDS